MVTSFLIGEMESCPARAHIRVHRARSGRDPLRVATLHPVRGSLATLKQVVVARVLRRSNPITSTTPAGQHNTPPTTTAISPHSVGGKQRPVWIGMGCHGAILQVQQIEAWGHRVSDRSPLALMTPIVYGPETLPGLVVHCRTGQAFSPINNLLQAASFTATLAFQIHYRSPPTVGSVL